MLPGMLHVKLQRAAIDRFGVGKDGGINPDLGGEFASLSVQCSLSGVPVGPALLQPGWRGLLGAGQSQLTAGGVFVQGKDCI